MVYGTCKTAFNSDNVLVLPEDDPEWSKLVVVDVMVKPNKTCVKMDVEFCLYIYNTTGA
jgi:hypothetical protein